MKYNIETLLHQQPTQSLDNLVFLDIETTGLNPSNGAKIIEIAMLKILNGKQQQYQTLVNPESLIPKECSRIHHIYDNMVKTAPYFRHIAKNVISFLSGSVVVCHNASFDLLFVHKELHDAGYFLKNIYYIDTLHIARRYFSFKSNKLCNIAKTLGINVKQNHRAMADVLTTLSVANCLFKDMYEREIKLILPNSYQYTPNK
ncbi:MAG: 3'-5' exonuclease [Endomicrobium sp.]|jgi:DNA polymerase III epsilon subunit family exonuclease|nr:3'-5' exonuclease [Endomicrobium sp.]